MEYNGGKITDPNFVPKPLKVAINPRFRLKNNIAKKPNVDFTSDFNENDRKSINIEEVFAPLNSQEWYPVPLQKNNLDLPETMGPVLFDHQPSSP